MLKGKKFQNVKDQKVVSVLEDNGIWVTLDDSTNIKTDVFLTKYTEYFEVDNFFKSDPVMEKLAQQFNEKVINSSPIVGPSGFEMSGANQPAGYVIEETPQDKERQRQELLAKYSNYTPPQVVDQIDINSIGNPDYPKQQPMQRRERGTYVPPESTTEVKNLDTGEVIMKPNIPQASYTEEPNVYDIYEKAIPKTQPAPQQPYQAPVQPPVQSSTQQPYQAPPVQQTVQMTPEQEAFMFFKKFKKIHPIDVKLTFKEMIADPTYLRQTAMNFEGDIVKFYTRELMNKLWDKPSLLENQIYEEFKKIILGENLKETIQSTIKQIDEESNSDLEKSIKFSEYADPEEPENPINYSNYIAEQMEKPIPELKDEENVIIPEKVIKINGEYE